jgi:TIR domain
MTFRERRRPYDGGSGRRASCWQRRPQIAFAVCWSDAAWSSSRCDIGTERNEAEQLADILRGAGYAVFYDNYYPEHLWGKNLPVFFEEIFRKRARFCVMFVSKDYRDRKWTSLEARSAQARAEKGNEYILPIRVDDTELEGLLPTVGYVPIATGIESIGDMLLKKLQTQ